MYKTHRYRRLRKTKAIRNLIRETTLNASDFIMPIFVQEGSQKITPIQELPGINRYTMDCLTDHLDEIQHYNIPGIALFPVIPETKKTSDCKEGLNPNGLMSETIKAIKTSHPNLLIFSDVACDPYSSDGHDGLVRNNEIENDESVSFLVEMAICQAKAGADFVAPSDMMDFRVGAIREGLDKAGYCDTGICAYSIKYASSLYGPFREALNSKPKKGDKKSYQMDPANKIEALKEAKKDLQEGADIIMIKPAMAYLDIIQTVKESVDAPIMAYHVSGEYAMIKAASQKGWLDDVAVINEALTGIKRAGADCIITYAALEWARNNSL